MKKERSVAMGQMAGAAKHLHLSRVARLAGEAFAFAEPEAVAPAQRAILPGSILLLMLGALAAAGLWAAF